MRKHNTLGQACGTASVENICQIIWQNLLRTGTNNALVHVCGRCEEIVKIHTDLVLCIEADITTEDNQFFQCGTVLEHPECNIVLFLLTNKDISDTGIADNILDLHFAAGSIQRYHYCPYGVRSKIYHQPLWHVLGEYSNIFLLCHAQCNHCIGQAPYSKRELFP